MTRVKAVLLALAVIAISSRSSAESDLYKHQVEKIADGVYVAYRPEPLRIFVESNVTIIINDDDVVVVDAGGSTASAQDIIAHIRELTSKPVRTLINTHEHVDHTLGNAEFARQFPGLEIISTEETRKHLLEDAPEYVTALAKELGPNLKRGEDQKQRAREANAPGAEKVIAYLDRYNKEDIFVRQAEYKRAVIKGATATYENKLVLYRGGRTIELRFLGWGDTPGDTVVYLPNEKIACTGDMLVEPVPYGLSVRPKEWLATLGRLSELETKTLVPGHGAVQHDKRYLQLVMRLIDTVQKQVTALAARENDLESVRKKVDLRELTEKFAKGDPIVRDRFEVWFIRPAVQVAYEAAKGTK
jgi:cyclase